VPNVAQALTEALSYVDRCTVHDDRLLVRLFELERRHRSYRGRALGDKTRLALSPGATNTWGTTDAPSIAALRCEAVRGCLANTR